jgi:hypothetical protein
MSQWHVLSGDENANGFTVVFHLPIPSANNRSGVNYQTAIVNSGIGGKTIMATGTGAGQITSTELASIQAGTLYEYVIQFFTNPGETQSAAATRLNNLYTQYSNTSNQPLLAIQNQLEYFGGTSAS